MRFFGNPKLKIDTHSVWFGVVLFLSLLVIWSFLSLEIYRTQLNYLELRILLFCQWGLVAIVFVSRYLLFQNARSPRLFRWASCFFYYVFWV